MKNVLTPLAKWVLEPVRLNATASTIDVAIQKKIYDLGMTILIFSNEEIDDMMRIIKSLEEFSLLIKSISEIVESEVKQQKRGILGISEAILGFSLLGNSLLGNSLLGNISLSAGN